MYVFAQTIPANTSKDNYITKTLKLNYGIINGFVINIPAGVYGLAGFRIYRGRTQIIPANSDAWITGDNINFHYETRIELLDPPYILTGYYYNEDTNYDHTITLQFLFEKNVWPRSVRKFESLMSI